MADTTGRRLTEAHYAAIGRVITSWSAVEYVLRMMAYALTANQPIDEGDDRTAAIVFEGMQVRTLVGVLQTLVQMRFPADEKGIKKFGERILKAKKQRDIFGHSLFDSGNELGTVRPLIVKTVGGLKGARGDFSVDGINMWAKENSELAALLLTILVRWGYFTIPDELPPD